MELSERWGRHEALEGNGTDLSTLEHREARGANLSTLKRSKTCGCQFLRYSRGGAGQKLTSCVEIDSSQKPRLAGPWGRHFDVAGSHAAAEEVTLSCLEFDDCNFLGK